jgi:hypothetical protein
MTEGANPYVWNGPPAHVMERPEVDALVGLLRRGGTALLHAGRGMGKTVMLRGVERRLRDLSVLHVDMPDGPDLGAHLAARLAPGMSLSDAVQAYLSAHEQLVILIDELDAWIAPERRVATRLALDQLAKFSREVHPGQVGVLAAGGIGHTILTHSPWGSTFASRVDRTFRLLPFDRSQLIALAAPLAGRSALTEAWMEELTLASGGIPLLACRVLQETWDVPDTSPVEVLGRFVKDQDGFLRSVRSSIQVEGASGPWSLLQRIQAGAGEIPYEDVYDAVGASADPLDALWVLISAGLVHQDCDTDGDPWRVRPNPSILRLTPKPPPRPASAWQALKEDVAQVVYELQRHAPDLYQGSGKDRKLVTEATVSGVIAMFLRARGWSVEREAQRRAGRTDVLVSGRGLDGHAIVEVKIWGRNDYAEIEAQVLSYALPAAPREAPTRGLFAVMVAEREVSSADYASKVVGLDGAPESAPGRWEREVRGPGDESLPLIHHLVDVKLRS